MVAGIRPEDFCYLQAVLAGDGEPKHYVLTGVVPTKTVDGVVIAPRSVYPLTTRLVEGDSSYEPITTVEVTGSTQSQSIDASQRLQMPCKWRSVGAWGTFSWLRNSGNGQQLGFNEDYREHQGEGGSTEVVHNPTFGGGLNQLDLLLMPENAIGMRVSPPIDGGWTAVGGAATAGVARIRGAVYPMQWSPDGQGQDSGSTGPENWDHGGELGVTDVLFWDHRQVADIRPAYLGDEMVHRCTLWSFQRTGWNSTNAAAAQPFYVATGWGPFVADVFDKAHILDLANNLSADVTPYLISAAYDNNLEIRKGGTKITAFAGPTVVVYQPSLIPSGYGAVIMRSTSPDFCVALAARIYDTGDGGRRLTMMGFGVFRHYSGVAYPGTVTTQDEALYGPGLYLKAEDSQRADGWIANSGYLVTGTYAEVTAKLAAMYAAGLFDTLPETDLPAGALDGTAAIPDYYLPEVVPETVTPVEDTSASAIIAQIDADLAKGIGVSSYVVDGQQVTLRSPLEMIEVRRQLLLDQARTSGVRRTRVSL